VGHGGVVFFRRSDDLGVFVRQRLDFRQNDISPHSYNKVHPDGTEGGRLENPSQHFARIFLETEADRMERESIQDK
ncbi:MAG: hypothetical protein MJ074_07300, partial [Oscillospiraceae bacterium]|nr:hypothetical protein [Oscillospiraceae bacterium]